MYIDPKNKKEMAEIMYGFKCPKDFKCYNSGLENLCKASYAGLKNRLKCMEESQRSCLFAIFIDNGYYCCCPIRTYIAKELNK